MPLRWSIYKERVGGVKHSVCSFVIITWPQGIFAYIVSGAGYGASNRGPCRQPKLGRISKDIRPKIHRELTTHASVVGLDVGLLDLAVLDDQGIALAAVVAKDGCGIEVEVESLGELAVRVGKEADLTRNNSAWFSQQQ